MVPRFKYYGGNCEQKSELCRKGGITAMVCYKTRRPFFEYFSKMSPGYWSSGTRLGDSSRVEGQGIEPGDLPEYMVRPLLLTPFLFKWLL